jgi:hypothetical protein
MSHDNPYYYNEGNPVKGKVRDHQNDTSSNQAAIYSNTVHGSHVIEKPDIDSFVTAELSSSPIQKDIVTLLESIDDRFSTSIGNDSPCHAPKR